MIDRNTSTDVEKTCMQESKLWDSKKHLHGRGEDPVSTATA